MAPDAAKAMVPKISMKKYNPVLNVHNLFLLKVLHAIL